MSFQSFYRNLLILTFVPISLWAQTMYWGQTSIPDSLSIASIERAPNGYLYIASSTYPYGGGYRSTDDGASWKRIIGGRNYSIAINQAGVVFAGPEFYLVPEIPFSYSLNQGDYWYEDDDPPLWGPIRSFLFPNTSEVYFVQGTRIGYTTDNGSNWIFRDTGVANQTSRILKMDPLVGIWLDGTTTNGIYFSYDEGKHWAPTQSASKGCVYVKDIKMIGSDYYFACSYLTGIFRSMYGGGDWTPIDTGLTTNHVYSLTIGLDSTVYAGTDSGVFQSKDFGLHWSSLSIGLPDSTIIYSLGTGSDGSIFAGTTGKGLYKSYQLKNYQPGWNLISLPLQLSNNDLHAIFPVTASAAYAYDSSYSQMNQLEHGRGYWLKFDNVTMPTYTGSIIDEDTVDLHKGWNMVGSISFPVPVNTITELPSGLTVSNYYGYIPEQGYIQADTMVPGMGYWVKTSQIGKIVLSSKIHTTQASIK